MSLDLSYSRRRRRDTPSTIPAPSPSTAELSAEAWARLVTNQLQEPEPPALIQIKRR